MPGVESLRIPDPDGRPVARAASAALQGKPFDKAACATLVPSRSCRPSFNLSSQKLLSKGICPTCLDGAHQAALADRVIADADGERIDLDCAGTDPLP